MNPATISAFPRWHKGSGAGFDVLILVLNALVGSWAFDICNQSSSDFDHLRPLYDLEEPHGWFTGAEACVTFVQETILLGPSNGKTPDRPHSGKDVHAALKAGMPVRR